MAEVGVRLDLEQETSFGPFEVWGALKLEVSLPGRFWLLQFKQQSSITQAGVPGPSEAQRDPPPSNLTRKSGTETGTGTRTGIGDRGHGVRALALWLEDSCPLAAFSQGGDRPGAPSPSGPSPICRNRPRLQGTVTGPLRGTVPELTII
jgi:hypothetical protein